MSQIRDRKRVKSLNILKLKAAMVERGVSIAELADQIGINRATLYRKMAACRITCDRKEMRKGERDGGF